MRTAIVLALLLAPAAAQEKEDEKILTFNFKDARVDDVLTYVSTITGWKFVFEANAKVPANATVTAVSDGPVTANQGLVILDTALRQHGLATVNSYAPKMPRKGDTVKIMKVEDAVNKVLEVHYGANPELVAPTDKVITQIVTLKGANVVDVQKELKETIDKCLEPNGKWSISTYSNSLIMTGRSDGIRRAMLILSIIDVKGTDELKTHVYTLKNADATETTKLLSEIFKKETSNAQRDANPMGRLFEMFGGGGRGGQNKDGPNPKTVATLPVMPRAA